MYKQRKCLGGLNRKNECAPQNSTVVELGNVSESISLIRKWSVYRERYGFRRKLGTSKKKQVRLTKCIQYHCRDHRHRKEPGLHGYMKRCEAFITVKQWRGSGKFEVDRKEYMKSNVNASGLKLSERNILSKKYAGNAQHG